MCRLILENTHWFLWLKEGTRKTFSIFQVGVMLGPSASKQHVVASCLMWKCFNRRLSSLQVFLLEFKMVFTSFSFFELCWFKKMKVCDVFESGLSVSVKLQRPRSHFCRIKGSQKTALVAGNPRIFYSVLQLRYRHKTSSVSSFLFDFTFLVSLAEACRQTVRRLQGPRKLWKSVQVWSQAPVHISVFTHTKTSLNCDTVGYVCDFASFHSALHVVLLSQMNVCVHVCVHAVSGAPLRKRWEMVCRVPVIT